MARVSRVLFLSVILTACRRTRVWVCGGLRRGNGFRRRWAGLNLRPAWVVTALNNIAFGQRPNRWTWRIRHSVVLTYMGTLYRYCPCFAQGTPWGSRTTSRPQNCTQLRREAAIRGVFQFQRKLLPNRHKLFFCRSPEHGRIRPLACQS